MSDRFLPQILSDDDADRHCRDVAQIVNDHLAGELVGIASIGALIFSAITSGRTALTTRENFLILAARYFDEGAAARRRHLN